MKINFSNLFQVDLEKYSHYFIYGNDKGVFERALSFLERSFSLEKEVRTEKEFLASPEKSPSLFQEASNRSLVHIPQVTDALLTHLAPASENIFVFMSEKARAQSKLVAHFAKAPRSLAIAAYSSPLILGEFQSMMAPFSLSPEHKQILFKAYQHNYTGLMTLSGYLELLGTEEPPPLALLLASSEGSEESASLLKGVLLRDGAHMTQVLSTVLPGDLIFSLRMLGRAFLTLLEVIPHRSSPKAIPWQSLSTPVFFKDVPLFEKAISCWHPQEISSFLERLLFLEKNIKYAEWGNSQVSQSLLTGVLGRKCFT